jgi:hypothetical protein|tara:strand:- start:10 stop:243 length:234 start_codon:yes stop_codon:yes gene_type:complete
MRLTIVKALKSYLRGHIEKHIANVNVHLENTVGVAEHSDHLETIEKELETIAGYEDKLNVLIKHFDEERDSKEVIHG